MLRHYGKSLAITLLGLFSHAVLAVENTDNSKTNNLISFFTSSFVATLSAGPAWESAGQGQTLGLTSSVEKTYTTNRQNNSIANSDLFLGIQKPLSERLQGQMGLDFAVAGNATLSGDIWDDANPAFDNYTYQYNIRHTHIALKGKLLGDVGWPVQPWVSATVGVGFNRSYDFTNTPIINQAIETTNFSSKTVTAFTYALGIGVQHVLSKNWQLGVGYEFADWGRSQLGPVSGSATNQSPSLSHLYTSSVLVSVTYLA